MNETRSEADWAFQAGITDKVMERLAMKVKRRKTAKRRRAKAAAAVVILSLGLFWAVPAYKDTSTVETASSHREDLSLEDGSHADLNALTSLKTDFRYDRRTVILERGEAFFSVHKDPTHPFLVETPSGTVRVTGTQFNVRLAPKGLEVSLLEGAVIIQSPGSDVPAATLRSGEQILLSSGHSSVRVLNAAELDAVASWRNGSLVLDHLTLAEVAERLSAYNGKAIRVAPSAADLRPGGTVPLDHLEACLDALQAALPVKVSRQADGSIQIDSRK